MPNNQFPLPISLGIIAFGVLPLLPAIFNWDWFFNLPFFEEGPIGMLGRQAQRLLYGIIGVAIVALGTAMLFGLITPL
jgi:hypothetical protein